MANHSNLDPELAARFAKIQALGFLVGSIDELVGLRRGRSGRMESLLGSQPAYEQVTSEDLVVPGPVDAPHLMIRVYRPRAVGGILPCLYSIHGGGMVAGSVADEDRFCECYVHDVGCVVVSVEYRLAPENPYPAAVEDCHAGLRWVAEHASDLGIDARRIAVGGASAGGGLAAATVLLARDRGGPPINFQLLVQPMLDDQNSTPSSRDSHPVWRREANTLFPAMQSVQRT